MDIDPVGSRAVEEVQRLFPRHGGLLRGFILGLMPDRDRAEDVLQELFLTITRKAADSAPGTNFLAWARSIDRLKVLEAFRSSRAGPCLLEPDALEAVCLAAEEAGDKGWWRGTWRPPRPGKRRTRCGGRMPWRGPRTG
ncbi:MAG: hypothetical protein K2W96_26535 [Gemmataceae bacterium]|nr:hypothetical protein [Gemmataceae bacterium]